MWVENLDAEERKILNMISGSLSLPPLSEYLNKNHYLRDVYGRIREAKSISDQISSILGNKTIK